MFTLRLKKKKSDTGDTTEADALMNKNVKSGGKSGTTWLSDIRYGQSISVEFFKRNAWLLVLLLIIVLSLMGVRYRTKTRMLEINRLERELKQAESEKLHEKAQYMSLIRETEMQRLVDENHLGLQFQEQPPYDVEAAE